MKLKSSKFGLGTLAAAGLALTIAGCGKKSGGNDAADDQAGNAGGGETVSDVNGVVNAATIDLQLAPTINLIPAKEEGAALTDLTDAEAKINYRVREESTQNLEQIQGIMCFLSQTRYAEMANLGPYVALVDENKCFKNGSNNQGVSLTRVKILSEREEGKALVVKIWFAAEEKGEEAMQVQLKVAEGSSATNPIGIFRIDFGHGYVESRRNADGELEVYFLESEDRGSEAWANKTAVRLSVDTTTGQIVGGRMVTTSEEKYDGKSKTASFQVVFDESLINRAGVVNDKPSDACLSRDAYTSRAWNYNVYKADGSLYTLKSGFSIEFEQGGEVQQGYASYWGVSGQNGSSLSGVKKVSKVDYSTGTKVLTPYTLKSAPGKLYKMTKQSIKLADLKGTEMSQWTMDGGFIVKWDGKKFAKVASVTYGSNGEVRKPASGEAELDQWSGGYRLYVNNLNGDIFVPAEEANDAFVVSYFERTMVSGTDKVPSGELVCFDRCIKADATSEEFGQQSFGPQASGPFVRTTGYEEGQESNTALNMSEALATYSWDASTHNLVVGEAPFVLPAASGGSKEGSDGQSMGMSQQTGALVPKAVWEALSSEDKAKAPYELERLVKAYYTFEAGSPYSQYTALADADGKVVSFDQPVNFTYVHEQAKDLNGAASSEFYGQTFSLQYGGPGNLWGIPWDENKMEGNSASRFSLAVGAEIEAGIRVLPVEVEQILTPVDAAQCAGVPIDSLPELPTEAPAAVDNGAIPSDDTPVKVNGGELVGA